MNQKLILENWRKFLKEEVDELTKVKQETAEEVESDTAVRPQPTEQEKTEAAKETIINSVEHSLTNAVATAKKNSISPISLKNDLINSLNNLVREEKKKKFKLNENTTNNQLEEIANQTFRLFSGKGDRKTLQSAIYDYFTKDSSVKDEVVKAMQDTNRRTQYNQYWDKVKNKLSEIAKNNGWTIDDSGAWFQFTKPYNSSKTSGNFKYYITFEKGQKYFDNINKLGKLITSLNSKKTNGKVSFKIATHFLAGYQHNDSVVIHYNYKEDEQAVVASVKEANFETVDRQKMGRTDLGRDEDTSDSDLVAKKAVDNIEQNKNVLLPLLSAEKTSQEYKKGLSGIKHIIDTLMQKSSHRNVTEAKKKKSGDRCTRIAKRKYDVWPSAYASGAVVKCRQGKIWKGVSENASDQEIDDALLLEEIEIIEEQQIQLNEKCWKGYTQKGMKTMFGKKYPNCVKVTKESVDLEEANTLEEKWSEKYKSSIDCKNPKGFSQKAHCQGKKKNEDIDLGEVEIMEEAKKKAYKPNFSKEKEQGLHGWFARNDGKGWVNCRTGGPCGRDNADSGGKYPACRPTKAQCKSAGKGPLRKKKSSSPISWTKKKKKD